MHRSASTTRASDEFYVGMLVGGTTSPPLAAGKGGSPAQLRASLPSGGGAPLVESEHLLPKYDTQSSFAKKEAGRARSAESAIHLIPVVLIACAVVLWLFSTPQTDVAASKGGSAVAVIENATIEEGHGNTTNPPILEEALRAEQINNEEEVNGGIPSDKEKPE